MTKVLLTNVVLLLLLFPHLPLQLHSSWKLHVL